MSVKRSRLSPYDSVYTALPPAAASTTSRRSDGEPLIPTDVSQSITDEAKSVDSFKLEMGARVKSLEFVTRTSKSRTMPNAKQSTKHCKPKLTL